MNFQPLLDILADYGMLGLIIIIIVALIVYLIRSNGKQLNQDITSGMENVANKITDQMASSNNQLINKISDTNNKLIDQQNKMLDVLINGRREEHRSRLHERLDVTAPILTKLRDMMHHNHANRASVIEFHNSKENLNGLPFLWYDMHYEVQGRGVEPISSLCKDVQASIICPIVDDIKASENKDVVIYNRTALEELYDRSSVLYSYLVEKLNCSGIIYLALYNINNHFTGLLVLEYHNEFPIDIIDMDQLIQDAASVSPLLELAKKEQNKDKMTETA